MDWLAPAVLQLTHVGRTHAADMIRLKSPRRTSSVGTN